jgi:YtcA family
VLTAAVLYHPVQIAHNASATVIDTHEGSAGRDARDRAASMPRASMTALALMVMGLMTGCSGSPSRSILGSYFPSWMVCALIGLVAALVARVALKATGLLGELPAPLVVLLSVGCATTFALWLLWLA